MITKLNKEIEKCTTMQDMINGDVAEILEEVFKRRLCFALAKTNKGALTFYVPSVGDSYSSGATLKVRILPKDTRLIIT